MAKKKDNKTGLISTNQTVADNKRARFDYALEESFEAGIALKGTEVKSLRMGQCALKESHIIVQAGALFLLNAHIPEYKQAGPHLQHDPKRARKLLLKKREIDKLMGATNKSGYTIVPIKLYFDSRGLAKLEIALAKGKKQYDKRETMKDRDWGREKQRVMKDHNNS